MNFKYSTLFVTIIILVCCITPALLLYFLGYVAYSDWNKSLIETTCNVTDHQVKRNVCSASCGCYSGKPCQKCYYTCYDGYISITYNVSTNESYTETIKVESGKNYIYTVENDLNKYYPLGKKIACYYNKNDPAHAKLRLADTLIFLGFFIVFCCLGGIIMVAWLVFACVSKSYFAISEYQPFV